ncbi:cobalamin-dependent protein [uncultured Ilyobacter sp.]|uniref:cobalamin-dependent protein n=1 Tax=uncultured Ilyobacter sp. TaxID=544433 RepID=UPI0029C6835F|nr:cobalamin-dependent protein [uncultured Ilyobacter sp.]
MKNIYSVPRGEVVSYASAAEYEKNIPTMTESVNSIMTKINSTENLIGDNPLSVMHDNHIHHSKFMANIFKLNDYELLNNTLKWVLNSYVSRGFKSKYFQIELDTWISVIRDTLEPNYSSGIIKIYQWMKSALENIERENKNLINEIPYPFDSDWENVKNKFFNLLIKGNSAEALSFSKSIVHDRESLENFYSKVITYSMYEVGLLWEKGLISVAQEHLATSIVMRIISYLYMNFILIESSKGKAIITASANEFHEIGARIISDQLELDGWNVLYLGANIPNEELIKIIKEENPDFIGISVAMAFNINKVKELVAQIRSDSTLNYMKILVGGHAFTFGGDSKEKIGADKISFSIDETINTARLWWDDKSESKFK